MKNAPNSINPSCAHASSSVTVIYDGYGVGRDDDFMAFAHLSMSLRIPILSSVVHITFHSHSYHYHTFPIIEGPKACLFIASLMFPTDVPQVSLHTCIEFGEAYTHQSSTWRQILGLSP